MLWNSTALPLTCWRLLSCDALSYLCRSSARADTAGEPADDPQQEAAGGVVSKRVGRSTKTSLAVNAEVQTVAAQVQARQQQQGRGRTQDTGTGTQEDLQQQQAAQEQEWPDDWAYLALNMVKVCAQTSRLCGLWRPQTAACIC
jgi:cobalamin biosynthesis Mg chelatase CobN